MPQKMDTRDRLAGLVVAQSVPTRRQWQRRVRLLLLGGVGWSSLITLGLLRSAARDLWLWTLGTVGGFVLLAMFAGFFALSSGGSALGRSRSQLFIVAWFTMLVPLVGAGMLGSPASALLEPSARAHLACLMATVAVALGPFAAIFFAKRASDYIRPRITGMLVGALSGAIGGIGISLHCAERMTWHLVVGHALPVTLVGILGWILGDRILGGHLGR